MSLFEHKIPQFARICLFFASFKHKKPFFVRVFVLTSRDLGGRGEAVDVEDAVEVIDLVLEDHRGESLHSVSNDLK